MYSLYIIVKLNMEMQVWVWNTRCVSHNILRLVQLTRLILLKLCLYYWLIITSPSHQHNWTRSSSIRHLLTLNHVYVIPPSNHNTLKLDSQHCFVPQHVPLLFTGFQSVYSIFYVFTDKSHLSLLPSHTYHHFSFLQMLNPDKLHTKLFFSWMYRYTYWRKSNLLSTHLLLYLNWTFK